MAACNAVVFDLGGVLIHWDPRLLYRKLLPTAEAVEEFLCAVCTPEWNAQQDAGRPFQEGISDLVSKFPHQATLIAAWHDRFDEMIFPMEDSIEVLRELHQRGVPLYALSNWGAETFDVTRHMFPFLEWFRALVISGQVGLVKPDHRIFHLLLREYDLRASEVVFIDDHLPNVETAARLGFQAIQFTNASELREVLEERGLL